MRTTLGKNKMRKGACRILSLIFLTFFILGCWTSQAMAGRRFFNQFRDPESRKGHRWESLSEEERTRLIQRYQRWENMSPEERARIKEKYRRFKGLSEEDRSKIRKKWKQFKRFPEGKRRGLRRKYKKWKHGHRDRPGNVMEGHHRLHEKSYKEKGTFHKNKGKHWFWEKEE